MTTLSCLFGAASEPLIRGLQQEPVGRERLHLFRQCPGLNLGGRELLVVHLRGAIDSAWPDEPDAWSRQRPAGLLAPPIEMHPWLVQGAGGSRAGLLPPPDLVARWAQIARETGEALAWWSWWEHGDDLYADAAWLFSPEKQAFAARETWLAAHRERALVYDDRGDSKPLDMAPLQLAMAHLDVASSLEYFVPADTWRFDWGPHRVAWSSSERET